MSRERTSRRFYRVESQYDLLAYMDRGETAMHENRWVLEVAWEAANKGKGIHEKRLGRMNVHLDTMLILVGGIYTVIRSKAYVSTEEMGDHYCLFGPYKEYFARQEVELCEFPPNSPLQIAAEKLREKGFVVGYQNPLSVFKPELVEPV